MEKIGDEETKEQNITISGNELCNYFSTLRNQTNNDDVKELIPSNKVPHGAALNKQTMAM